MRQGKRLLSFVIALVLSAQVLAGGTQVSADEATAISAVQRAYGSAYPLSSVNEIKTARKNIFGKYSKVLGVSAKYFTSYRAARKADSHQEYVSAVFKASKKKNVKKIQSALKKYVKSETSANANYFSAYGKSLLKNAKVGSKGRYVYVFILDTSKNKKAVKAFKRGV